MRKVKYPTIVGLAHLIKHVKADISDDCLAFEEDEKPGIQLTIGFNPKNGDWSYQTGDTQYTGGAYGLPEWATVGVYRNSNCRKLAKDIIEQLQSA